jgi:hypothetical protein
MQGSSWDRLPLIQQLEIAQPYSRCTGDVWQAHTELGRQHLAALLPQLRGDLTTVPAAITVAQVAQVWSVWWYACSCPALLTPGGFASVQHLNVIRLIRVT